MQVKLVSYTKSVDESQSLKDLIIYTARVSNPKSQEAGENIDRLWNYLETHNHWSPFEMAHLTFEIETTRDISRQIIRHRSFSFQEFSQRYADPTKELGFEYSEARTQHPTNRQLSVDSDDKHLNRLWVACQGRTKDVALGEYYKALQAGIAKEQARKLLPEGLTLTRMYMCGNIRSWKHYLAVRNSPDTQKEHRMVAEKIQELMDEFLNE